MEDYKVEDFVELSETGFESREPVAPEDEFFHSVYIAGQTRKNHMGIEEIADQLQIRGFQYNLKEINIVIINVKEILARISTKNNRESIDCFSYKEGPPPWKGTSGRTCGNTSAERASNDYCNLCRSQIIVAGIYCDKNGKPILNEENKPVFVFLRGKGMKYNNISNYLGDVFKMELDPIFKPVTEDSKRFEKKVVNNKRFVTNVTISEAPSNYGPKKVFNLEIGIQLPVSTTMDILKISKKVIGKFNDKFDWSKRAPSSSGYGQTPEGVLPIDEPGEPIAEYEEHMKQSEGQQEPFSFEDIEF